MYTLSKTFSLSKIKYSFFVILLAQKKIGKYNLNYKKNIGVSVCV